MPMPILTSKANPRFKSLRETLNSGGGKRSRTLLLGEKLIEAWAEQRGTAAGARLRLVIPDAIALQLVPVFGQIFAVWVVVGGAITTGGWVEVAAGVGAAVAVGSGVGESVGAAGSVGSDTFFESWQALPPFDQAMRGCGTTVSG